MQASVDLVSSDAAIELDQLRDLIGRNEGAALSKFVGDTSLSRERVSAFLSESVNTRLLKGNALAEALWMKATGKTAGIVVAEEAPWDTEHFGQRMGKITLAVFDDEVRPAQRRE